MKGIILAEFIEYIELELGELAAQKIIDNSNLASEGAYSRVGLYDYQELISLLTNAASESQQEAETLLDGFSNHLFLMFKKDYSMFFKDVDNAAHMLMQIDNHIHVEVKKLYPDAELPSFEYKLNDNELSLYYSSPRPLALVAHALVKACLHFFGDREKLIETTFSEDHKAAVFKINTSTS